MMINKRSFSVLIILCCILYSLPHLSFASTQNEELSFTEGLKRILSQLPKGKRVACADFTGNEGKKTKLTTEMTQLIEPMAVEIGKKYDLTFVERRDLKLIMKEWQLNMAGLTEGDVGARALIDADFLLIGKVLLDQSKVRCDLKLANLQNGEILGTAKVWRKADPVYFQWVAQAEADTAASLIKSNQATSTDTFLKLWTDAPKYEIGDHMKIFFEVAKPLYVKIIDVTPAGDVATIFPNPYQPDNFCQPGKRYQIPPPDGDFGLEVTPPVGVDRLKAIASEKPLPISPEIRTRGIRFTKEVMKSSPTRASISFAIN